MVESVSGYLAKDGTFFQSREEAEQHESREALIAALQETNGKINVIAFLEVINANATQVQRFLTAHNIKGPSTSRRHAYDIAQAEGAAPVEQQPAGGRKHMPDIRHRSQSEAVRDDREGDGLGGRERDA